MDVGLGKVDRLGASWVSCGLGVLAGARVDFGWAGGDSHINGAVHSLGMWRVFSRAARDFRWAAGDGNIDCVIDSTGSCGRRQGRDDSN